MDEIERKPKRPRSANYTESEKKLLFSLVFKYKNILENKKTDGVSTDEKKSTWEKIAKQFNSAVPGFTHRNTDSPKKLYENSKKELRKAKAEERKELYKTGGGLPTPFLKKTDDDMLLSVVNTKSIFGMENPFDGDSLVQPNGQTIDMLQENSQETPTTSSSQETCNQGGSEIRKNDAINGSSDHNYTYILRSEDTSPTSSRVTLKEINEYHQDNNNHENNNVAKALNGQRHPATVVRALASSNIAQKYDMLLDKRLEICNMEMGKIKGLVRQREEEHELNKTLISVDIAIKREKLRKLREEN